MAAKAASVAKTEANAVAIRPVWAKDLSDREMVFVDHYVRELNALQAALACGTPKVSAGVYGHECKNRPHVRAVIDILLRDRMSSLKLSLAERLTAVALQNPEDYYRWGSKVVTETRGDGFKPDGTPKYKTRKVTVPTVDLTPSHKLTQRQLAAVKGVKKRITAAGTTIELQLHDPLDATDRLAKLLGMQQVEQGAGGGQVVFVIEAPEGTVIREAKTAGIDRGAIDAEIAKNAEPSPDELPPGAKGLVIERP